MYWTIEEVHKIDECSTDTPLSDSYKIIQNCALGSTHSLYNTLHTAFSKTSSTEYVTNEEFPPENFSTFNQKLPPDV